MICDVLKTAELARAAGLTYGGYVAKYGIETGAPKSKPQKERKCPCGADISHKYTTAVYCDDCIKQRAIERRTATKNKLEYGKASYKTHNQLKQG